MKTKQSLFREGTIELRAKTVAKRDIIDLLFTRDDTAAAAAAGGGGLI